MEAHESSSNPLDDVEAYVLAQFCLLSWVQARQSTERNSSSNTRFCFAHKKLDTNSLESKTCKKERCPSSCSTSIHMLRFSPLPQEISPHEMTQLDSTSRAVNVTLPKFEYPNWRARYCSPATIKKSSHVKYDAIRQHNMNHLENRSRHESKLWCRGRQASLFCAYT